MEAHRREVKKRQRKKPERNSRKKHHERNILQVPSVSGRVFLAFVDVQFHLGTATYAGLIVCGARMRAIEEFKMKSGENWEAGELCRNNGKHNAAASRFYYSLYLSARYWADKNDIIRWSPSYRVKHATMVNTVGTNAGQTHRDALNNLLMLRETADYDKESVDPTESKDIVQKASVARSFFLK